MHRISSRRLAALVALSSTLCVGVAGTWPYSSWNNSSIPIAVANSEGHFMVSDPATGTTVTTRGSLMISVEATATVNAGNCEFGAHAVDQDSRVFFISLPIITFGKDKS